MQWKAYWRQSEIKSFTRIVYLVLMNVSEC